MENNQIKLNQIISYTNGSTTILKGRVMQLHYEGKAITVIDPANESAMILWNAGFSVGAYIYNSQIVS